MIHKNTQIRTQIGARKISRLFCVLLSVSLALISLAAMPFMAVAEEGLTLTITPPLFQLTIGPGEFWSSSLKVVNTNSYDLTLYASVMNFESNGERGGGKFTPIIEDDGVASVNSLAQWIEVSKKPIFVPKEKSVEIPFSVRIPKDAPPGGHYAAILVGTQPLSDKSEGPIIRVSSLISSLLFVNIKGDVREEGNIREFSTEKTFYQEPEVDFTLRFENIGNVHLQPQGDITIYNMWGKERGKILINQKSHFGNVLPKSIREFAFKWQGENNLFEIGRYKAIATLSFGKEARQNIFRATYFWVVPLKPTLGILGSFIALILFVAWSIRSYIKKALEMEKGRIGFIPQKSQFQKSQLEVLSEPIIEGVIDLRSLHDRAKQTQNDTLNRRKTFSVSFALRNFALVSRLARVGFAFLKKYYKFFLFTALFIIGLIVIIIFFKQVLMRERSFEIIVPQEDGGMP